MRKKELIKDSLGENYDRLKLHRYLVLLLHLDTAMTNVMSSLTDELKIRGLFRFDIKKQIRIIQERLKTNPKNQWETIPEENVDNFCHDTEMFEDMCLRFTGLINGYSIVAAPVFGCGDRIWTRDDRSQPILCQVEAIKIDMEVTAEKGLKDTSYYVLRRLTTKTMKPTKDIFHRSEEQVYKSLKFLQDDKK